MILNTIVFFLSVILFAVLSYITCGIWFKSRHTAELKLFFTLGLMLSFWTLFNGISIVLTQELYEIVYPFYLIIVCFLPTIFLWYFLYLTNSKLTEKKYLVPVLAIFPVTDFVILLSNPWHKRLITGYNGLRPLGGDLFPLHVILGYTPLLIGLIILLVYIIKNIKRIPALAYVGFGVFLTITFNVIYTFGIIDFGFDVTPFTFVVLFSGFIIYSAKLKQFELNETVELAASKAAFDEANELQLTKLNAVVKATKIGLYDVGINNNDFFHPDNTYVFTDEFRNMLGYTNETDFPNIFDSWKSRLHPDDIENAIVDVENHISDATGKTPYDAEYRLLRKDGEYAYFRACGEAIRDKYGNTIRIAGALMDITETRKSLIENELQLAKINLINKAARIGLWDLEVIHDDTMNIKNVITYSAEFREILGYTDENDFPNVLSSFYGCLHPDDYQMVTDKINAHILDTTGKTLFDTEYQAKRKDGEYIYIRATGQSIRDEKGNAIRTLGTIMDISEEKNTLATTEALRKQAEDANQSKSVFLANMSHEIRTPLNAVIGLSDLIIDTDATLSLESRYRLDQINSAGATLFNTVNNILDISKIEAGKFELITAMYDIPSMINDAVTQSIMHREDKPIEFILRLSDNMPTNLYGDELRIKQILNNFLSNAFKYTLNGFVEFDISFVQEDESVWLTFKIRDTGIGIRQEDINNLFSDYVQLDMSSNRNVIGTGLGLSIAKRLVDLMDGEITVESEYGVGSVFTVSILQKHATDNVIGPEAVDSLKRLNYYEHKRRQHGPISRISLPYARVLLVDDVTTNLDVTKGLMKPYNMQIDCVRSGQESINAMLDSTVRYNAIFMDHMMPGMDGMEAMQKIREIGTDYAKNIPIIALTANAIVGNKEMFLQNGFQAFISKPIEIIHLDTVIRQWVRDEEQENNYRYAIDSDLPSIDDKMNWQALYKGVPGLDIEKGLVHFYNDKPAYISVLRSYAKNTPPLLDAAEDFNKDNLPHYTTMLHGIKGSSSGIHADKIAIFAEALEKAARSGDCIYILANNKNLIETTRKLIYDIEVMLDEIDSDNSKPKKDKPDGEILNKLHSACESYEMDSVDAALAELEAYEYENAKDNEFIIWLRENVEQLNFEEIMKRITEVSETFVNHSPGSRFGAF